VHDLCFVFVEYIFLYFIFVKVCNCRIQQRLLTYSSDVLICIVSNNVNYYNDYMYDIVNNHIFAAVGRPIVR